MLKVSAIITAAGKNSRMRKDQMERNIPLQNKLTLPFNSSTIIETTIANVLNTDNIDECIVVLGHFSDEILPLINKIDDSRLKIIENDPVDVGLSVSILKFENPKNTISILRRLKTGKLDTAEGLGMPFAASRLELIDYLKGKDDNLNPILREMFSDGFDFYGIEEDNPLELININTYSEYESIL